MDMRKAELAVLGIVLLSLALGIYFYPQMPQQMASHWNSRGEVDGYMSKFWGTFIMPFILFGLALLFIAIPRIDPLKENIEKSRRYYEGFIILFSVFMLLVYIQMLLWNIGTEISLNVVLPVGVGILFFYMGILCENIKRNWFIGIRTPWTLSSEVVWEKTHKIGGRLFKIAGVVAIAGVFFQGYVVFFVVVPAVLAAGYSFVYSYFEYRRVVR
jgi:uncharacterized membrane protein